MTDFKRNAFSRVYAANLPMRKNAAGWSWFITKVIFRFRSNFIQLQIGQIACRNDFVQKYAYVYRNNVLLTMQVDESLA